MEPRPRLRSVLLIAVPVCAAGVLWLQLVHAALGAREHHEPGLVVHWLRDGAFALPVVVSCVWLILLYGGRRLAGRPVLTALVLGLAATAGLALGAPAHGWLFGAHAAAGQSEPPFLVHLVRDAALALPAALLAVVVGLWLARPRAPEIPTAAPRTGESAVALERPLTRRQAIGLGVAGGAALVLPFRWAQGVGASDFASPPATPFAQALPVPPVARPVARTVAADQIVLTARVGESQIYPTGPKTRIWGYDGAAPGPTILAEGGRANDVTFVHALEGERTPDGEEVRLTTHLHGGHQAPRDDGWATDLDGFGLTALIQPGASRDYHYPNLHDLANGVPEIGLPLWYHDHLMDQTGFTVYQGLAGVYRVHNAAEDDFDLPGTGADELPDHGYGAVDLPLLLQDRKFRADHSLFYDHDPKGVLGDRLLVNGAIQPFTEVRRRRHRLRFYNGSNRRWYNLSLSNGAPFVQIGTDQGLLAAPVTRTTMLIAPAERLDVIVDFANAPSTVDLVTRPAGFDECDISAPLLRFNVLPGTVMDRSRIPDRLQTIRPLPAPDRRRTFRFERSGGQWVVNGRPFDPERPIAEVRLGATEAWTLENRSGGWVHPIHIHDVPFRVISRDGRTPPPWERGEKDTIALPRNSRVEVALEFIDFTGPYVFHCHNIEHEDMRMMARFDVVA